MSLKDEHENQGKIWELKNKWLAENDWLWARTCDKCQGWNEDDVKKAKNLTYEIELRLFGFSVERYGSGLGESMHD